MSERKYCNIETAFSQNIIIRDKIFTIVNIINKRKIKQCWYSKLIKPEDILTQIRAIMKKDKSLSELEAIQIIRKQLDEV